MAASSEAIREARDQPGWSSSHRGTRLGWTIYVEMLRPKTVLVRGISLAGEQVEFEADELEARMFQHEIDHLNGILMFDRLEGDQRKEALAEYRRIEEEAAGQRPKREPLVRRLRLS